MVTADEYVEAVKASMREIRAYLVGGRDMDTTAPVDVASVSALSAVDTALTDWDALTDGRTEGGAVVSVEGAVSMGVRVTFGGDHGWPVVVHTSPNVKTVVIRWRDASGNLLRESNRSTLGAGSDRFRFDEPATMIGPVMDVTISNLDATERLEIREVVFGNGRPVSKGVRRIAWCESRGDVLDKWDVNDLTVQMTVGMDEVSPVGRGDRLYLAMDVTCPSGIVRVPCGVWLVDRITRAGSDLTITAYDMRIKLNEVVNRDVMAGFGDGVAGLMEGLGIPFQHWDVVPLEYESTDLDEVLAEGGTYADLIYRTMLRKGLLLYVRDDGTVSTSENYDLDDPDGDLEPPIRWTIGGGQVFERVDPVESDTCAVVISRWPGGESIDQTIHEDGMLTIDYPIQPLHVLPPLRTRFLRYGLTWSGDPQFWGMDTGSSARFAMEDVPGIPAGPFRVEQVEHVFDGGYRQEVRFFSEN